MRKVIIVHNVFYQDITVYSNRQKVYKKYESMIDYSYQVFCQKVKRGLTVTKNNALGFPTEFIFKELPIY